MRASSFPPVSFRLSVAIALLSAATLAACSVGDPYRPPAADAARTAPFDAAADAPVASGGALPDRWWQLFDDPTLDALVREARAEPRSRGGCGTCRAGAGRARRRAPRGCPIRQPASASTTASTRPTRSSRARRAPMRGCAGVTRRRSRCREVDLWGRVGHLVDAARADSEAVQAASDAMRVAVAAETTAAYAQACAYGERIDVAERSVAIAERLATLTARQRAHGLVSDLEVARSRAFADDTRAELPALAGARRAALYELAVLTGHAPGAIPTRPRAATRRRRWRDRFRSATVPRCSGAGPTCAKASAGSPRRTHGSASRRPSCTRRSCSAGR